MLWPHSSGQEYQTAMITSSASDPGRDGRARRAVACLATLGLFAAISITPAIAAPPGGAPGQQQCQEVGSNCQKDPTPDPSVEPTPDPTPDPSVEPTPDPTPDPTPEPLGPMPQDTTPTPEGSAPDDDLVVVPSPSDDRARDATGTPAPAAPIREDQRGAIHPGARPADDSTPSVPMTSETSLPDTRAAEVTEQLTAILGLSFVAVAGVLAAWRLRRADEVV